MSKECLIGLTVVLMGCLLSMLAMKSSTEYIETKIEASGDSMTNTIHELRMSIQEFHDALKQHRQMMEHFDYMVKSDV